VGSVVLEKILSILKRWQFYVKLAVCSNTALILGFLFSKKIDLLLESSLTVAISMLAAGL